MSRATDMHGFLPDDYVELKTQRRTNILWAMIFLIVAGGIGWAYFIAQDKVKRAEDLNRQVNEAFANAAKPIREFQQMQEEQQRLNLKAELVGSLIERVNRSNILATLTNSLPSGVYLSDFDLSGKPRVDAASKSAYERAKANAAGAAAAAKPIIYDVTMKVKGYSLTDTQMTEYMANLQKSPLFKEVVFDSTEEVKLKEIKLRSFELSITLNPDADSRMMAPANTAQATAK